MWIFGGGVSGMFEERVDQAWNPLYRSTELKMFYKGEPLKQTCKPDLVCFGLVLKALSSTTGKDKAQVLNCMKATGARLGLLVNFGSRPKSNCRKNYSMKPFVLFVNFVDQLISSWRANMNNRDIYQRTQPPEGSSTRVWQALTMREPVRRSPYSVTSWRHLSATANTQRVCHISSRPT
jgi:GxxExxY protein